MKAYLSPSLSRCILLMTTCAMIAGMTPMALGVGEGGDQTAPLGRAVVGGLLFATAATLFVLPGVFTLLQRKTSTASASLDPDDRESRHFDGTLPTRNSELGTRNEVPEH